MSFIAGTSIAISLEEAGVVERLPLTPGTQEVRLHFTAEAGGWKGGAIEIKRITGAVDKGAVTAFTTPKAASADGSESLDLTSTALDLASGLAIEVTTPASGAFVRVDMTEGGIE